MDGRPPARPQRTRLVVALVVGNALSVLLVEVEAVLHEELHRLRLDDVLLRTQQGQVVHLRQVRAVRLHTHNKKTFGYARTPADEPGV